MKSIYSTLIPNYLFVCTICTPIPAPVLALPRPTIDRTLQFFESFPGKFSHNLWWWTEFSSHGVPTYCRNTSSITKAQHCRTDEEGNSTAVPFTLRLTLRTSDKMLAYFQVKSFRWEALITVNWVNANDPQLPSNYITIETNYHYPSVLLHRYRFYSHRPVSN